MHLLPEGVVWLYKKSPGLLLARLLLGRLRRRHARLQLLLQVWPLGQTTRRVIEQHGHAALDCRMVCAYKARKSMRVHQARCFHTILHPVKQEVAIYICRHEQIVDVGLHIQPLLLHIIQQIRNGDRFSECWHSFAHAQ